MRTRILSACFICLFFVACDRQEKTSDINKTPKVVSKAPEVISKTAEVETAEVKTAPEKAMQQIARPPLNLSINDISIDHQGNDDDILNIDKEPKETLSDTFSTLSRNQAEPDISFSGKIFTDEEKLENKEYLDSIDGVQINIEGSFK